MRLKTRAALGLISVLASAGLLSACSITNGYNLVGAGGCYLPALNVDASNAREIAPLCTQASQESWPSVAAVANAAFHAGVAERLLGEKQASDGDAAAASAHFEAAATLLQRAISLAPSATSDRPRPPAKSDGMLELAWVRYDQGAYDVVLTQIDELLRLETNPESAVHASGHYLRGLALDANQQSLAALNDWGVFIDDALDEHFQATQARSRFIIVATRLGEEALARGTRVDTQAAIDLFARAQSAAEAGSWAFPWQDLPVDQAGIFINIGRARLDMAGLSSREGFADFACAADVGSAEYLDLARADFAGATRQDDRNPRAWRFLSCAELALGRTDPAIGAAERSVPFAPAAGVERAEDYRMLGRAYMQRDPVRAAAAFEEASRHAPDLPWRSRVLTELAAAYEASEQPIPARERLNQAVLDDPTNALAFVKLGVNYFETPPPAYAPSNDAMLNAERLTDPRHTMHDIASHDRDRGVRAQALYYLSRLRIEWPGHYDGQAATQYADEAFRLEGSSENRAQACLARVRAGAVSAGTPTLGYCSAIGQAAPSASSYLYEGVYHLRRAQYLRGGDNNRALEAAYRAFSEGLRILPSGDDRELQARLLQGQATSQYCIGFAQVGHDLEASIARLIGGQDAREIADAAHKFFDDYRVRTCDGSEHQH
jgi:tetratricopeptide (TPR) repeat protein